MDYSKVTLVEYEKRKKEVFNALRKESGASSCEGVDCCDCPFKILCNDNGTLEDAEMNEPVKAAQLIMEFEPPVDWSKVPVDAKILVKEPNDKIWYKRHFAEYHNGMVFAWEDRMTSYTADGKMSAWTRAKLYKEDGE